MEIVEYTVIAKCSPSLPNWIYYIQGDDVIQFNIDESYYTEVNIKPIKDDTEIKSLDQPCLLTVKCNRAYHDRFIKQCGYAVKLKKEHIWNHM